MNRIKAANDALWALIAETFPEVGGVQHHRNPKGPKAWASATLAVVLHDDRDPETIGVLSGGVHDLKLEPEILFARRGADADRDADQWADIETLKAALAADVTLNGVVEDARPSAVESADLDEAQWLGGGLAVRIRLLFAAPSAAG